MDADIVSLFFFNVDDVGESEGTVEFIYPEEVGPDILEVVLDHEGKALIFWQDEDLEGFDLAIFVDKFYDFMTKSWNGDKKFSIFNQTRLFRTALITEHVKVLKKRIIKKKILFILIRLKTAKLHPQQVLKQEAHLDWVEDKSKINIKSGQ